MDTWLALARGSSQHSQLTCCRRRFAREIWRSRIATLTLSFPVHHFTWESCNGWRQTLMTSTAYDVINDYPLMGQKRFINARVFSLTSITLVLLRLTTPPTERVQDPHHLLFVYIFVGSKELVIIQLQHAIKRIGRSHYTVVKMRKEVWG